MQSKREQEDVMIEYIDYLIGFLDTTIPRFMDNRPRLNASGLKTKGELLQRLDCDLETIKRDIKRSHASENKDGDEKKSESKGEFDLTLTEARLKRLTKAIATVLAKPRYPIISFIITWLSRIYLFGFLAEKSPLVPQSYQEWEDATLTKKTLWKDGESERLWRRLEINFEGTKKPGGKEFSFNSDKNAPIIKNCYEYEIALRAADKSKEAKRASRTMG